MIKGFSWTHNLEPTFNDIIIYCSKTYKLFLSDGSIITGKFNIRHMDDLLFLDFSNDTIEDISFTIDNYNNDCYLKLEEINFEKDN